MVTAGQQYSAALRRLLELAGDNEELLGAVTDVVDASRPIKHRSPAEWRFRVLRWEERDMVIHPRDGSGPKKIRALRLHVPLEDKLEDVPWWDVTSKRLEAFLRPILPMLVRTGRYVRLTKLGDGPSSSWTVQVEPRQG